MGEHLISAFAAAHERPETEPPQYLFRFVDRSTYGGWSVDLEAYPVVRLTPKGAWIGPCSAPKWVSLSAKRRYAWPTKRLAWRSYLARKARQRRIIKAQLQRVERILEAAPEEGSPPERPIEVPSPRFSLAEHL